jgi:AcrR family transcriptional regulator
MAKERIDARAPRQDRSRASHERMVAATLELLKERGDTGFTLAEVSKRGGVSIGSIYCRFENKDALVREVHGRLMTRYIKEQRAMLTRVGAHGGGLTSLIPRFVSEYAEFLRKRAPILSPLMVLASADEVIAHAGKQAHQEMAHGFRALALKHAADIKAANPQRATDSVFGVVYAALARHLGLGGAATAAGEGDWKVLKEDLGAMALAFLQRRS